MDFQIIEVDVLNKRVLPEPGFGMLFEILDIAVQPDRFAKIKLRADIVQSVKDLVRAGIVCIIADYGIRQHMIIFEDFGPYTEHNEIPLFL